MTSNILNLVTALQKSSWAQRRLRWCT